MLRSLTEKDRTRPRSVDLNMTVRAVRVLRVQVVLRTCGLFGADAVSRAMTGQTELRNTAGNQQTWVRRTVRRMT